MSHHFTLTFFFPKIRGKPASTWQEAKLAPMHAIFAASWDTPVGTDPCWSIPQWHRSSFGAKKTHSVSCPLNILKNHLALDFAIFKSLPVETATVSGNVYHMLSLWSILVDLLGFRLFAFCEAGVLKCPSQGVNKHVCRTTNFEMWQGVTLKTLKISFGNASELP